VKQKTTPKTTANRKKKKKNESNQIKSKTIQKHDLDG